MMYYTGIGSRETPGRIQVFMAGLASILAERGWVLRSGGAPGADMAFEHGSDAIPGPKEIFLPWPLFNADQRETVRPDGVVVGVTDEAIDIAKRYHPAFERLPQGTQKLLARNSYQILGLDLNTPTHLVVCWTPGGQGKGGTGQALRIARDLDIPVFDLGSYIDLGKAVDDIQTMIEVVTISNSS